MIKKVPKNVEFFPDTMFEWLDKEKVWTATKLIPNKIYKIRTEEPGMFIEFKAEFLGWEKVLADIPDNEYYNAIFKPIDNIKMEEVFATILMEV